MALGFIRAEQERCPQSQVIVFFTKPVFQQQALQVLQRIGIVEGWATALLKPRHETKRMVLSLVAWCSRKALMWFQSSQSARRAHPHALAHFTARLRERPALVRGSTNGLHLDASAQASQFKQAPRLSSSPFRTRTQARDRSPLSKSRRLWRFTPGLSHLAATLSANRGGVHFRTIRIMNTGESGIEHKLSNSPRTI